METRPVKAPRAAKLMRAIAAARKVHKFVPSRLFEQIREACERTGLPPLEDPVQVHRWFRGQQRIGLTNRERLLAAFPEFASEIEEAIRADARERPALSRRAIAAARSPAHARAAELFATFLDDLEDEADAMKLGKFLAELATIPYERSHADLMIALARARANEAQARVAVSTSVPYIPEEQPRPAVPAPTSESEPKGA